MSELVELWEQPVADEIYMLAGWRQWADAGSISSGLPHYIIQQTNARQIGKVNTEGFYLFQIPGTHDLVRPVVKFEEGYPKSLEKMRNEIHYTGTDERGFVIFLGDEPHLDIERYTAAFLDVAQQLKVKRIISFGGVYGELPYKKERMISSTYSLESMKEEISSLAVNLSDYHGGAAIGSYICRRAGDADLEYMSLYGFVPTYDFSNLAQTGSSIRLENDFMAWLGVMRRVNYVTKMDFDLDDLKKKTERLINVLDSKIEELDSTAPQIGIYDYLRRLEEDFTEKVFDPLDEVWEDELRRLFDDADSTD